MNIVMQWLSDIWSVIKTFQVKDLIDILVITFIIYSIIKLVKETRAEQLLKGIAVLFIVYVAALVLDLTMLTSLLRTFIEFIVLLVVIIFQPEIRKALEQIGRTNISKKGFFKRFKQKTVSEEWVTAQRKAISDVCDAAQVFSHSKTGALIVFERETKLSDIAATGTILNCQPSVPILGNLFFNKAPLHDGACIIRDGLLYSAGCILPLTSNDKLHSSLGTRHRAALGMSEESDAVVLVVSEETGTISIAENGVLLRDFSRDSLYKKLCELIIPKTDENGVLSIFSKKRKDKNDDEK